VSHKHYEVEQKFPVADLSEIERRVIALGARFEKTIQQSDGYFAHPARDFRSTDEALRIRREGDNCCVTYKGPKIDKTTKTRREIELPLAHGADGAEQFREFLQALGFSPIADVNKTRRTAHMLYRGKPVEIALDEVAGLGVFVELELSADEDGLAAAKDALNSLANELSLRDPERRSYLELLLGENTGCG
jgi:adenylate cyclase class 2